MFIQAVQDRKSPFTSANLITYAFLAFIAFMAFLGAAAAAFAAFLAILLSTGERSKPQGMRMSLKTSFLGHEEATAHRCPDDGLFLAKNQQSDVVLGTESGVPGTGPESQDPDAAPHPTTSPLREVPRAHRAQWTYLPRLHPHPPPTPPFPPNYQQ